MSLSPYRLIWEEGHKIENGYFRASFITCINLLILKFESSFPLVNAKFHLEV